MYLPSAFSSIVINFRVGSVLLLSSLGFVSHASAQSGAPSRQALPGCIWEQRSSTAVGLAAWVQRCDFGARKINLFFKDNALVVHYSDGGTPSAVIEVFDLLTDEQPESGVQRIFAAHTDKALIQRCVLKPYSETKAPRGVSRFTFVPDAAYAKELAASADPNDIPEPPCGEWGSAPDGIQYFEVAVDGYTNNKTRKVLFVRVGQDEPLFDENTLQIVDKNTAASVDKKTKNN